VPCPLIWNDPSSSRGGFSSFSDFLLLCALSEDPEVNESADEVGGFSTVDHADIRGSAFAAFMVTIRRELPRTSIVGRDHITDSRILHRWPARPLTRSLPVEFLLADSVGFHAALALSSSRSVSTPMDQMNPASSRARAVTIFGLGLPLFDSAQ
jgi:hypothetical protein